MRKPSENESEFNQTLRIMKDKIHQSSSSGSDHIDRDEEAYPVMEEETNPIGSITNLARAVQTLQK